VQHNLRIVALPLAASPINRGFENEGVSPNPCGSIGQAASGGNRPNTLSIPLAHTVLQPAPNRAD
jgi:hypothetical protein